MDRWLRMEIAEDEAARGREPPISQAALESAQLAIGEATRIGALESRKQLHSDLIRFGFEPGSHFQPNFLERIFTGAPRSCGARFRRMGRADFAGLPCECKTGEELGQIGVPHRRGMHPFAFGERGEMMLHGPDLIKQTQGI